MKKVKLHVSFRGANKIAAIKNIRFATGMMLKESKDYVETFWVQGSWSGPQVVMIISLEQFGALSVARQMPSSCGMAGCQELVDEMAIDSLELLTEHPLIRDFSDRGVL